MASIKFTLDTRRANKSEKFPLKIVVCHNQRNTIVSTGIYLAEIEWDDRNQRVTAKHKENKAINGDLSILYGKYAQVIKDLTESGRIAVMSVVDIKDRFVSSGNEFFSKVTFTGYFERFLDQAKIKTHTYEYAWSTLSKYTNGKTLLFEEVNFLWLSKFEDFMIEGGLAVNSRFTIFKAIRSIFNKAIDEEVIGQELYPFRRFKLKTEQTIKRSMTVEELRTFRDYPCQEHQERYRDLFMLIFYLIGINSIDLLNLKEIKDGRIEYRRAKTGRLYSIKVEPEALKIINAYKGENYLLNILDTYTDHKNFVHRLNQNLQKIGKVELVENKAKDPAKVKKNKKSITPLFPELTTYWARHTWATIAAKLDIPKETIAAALGHGGNEVTDIYIRFDEKKIDKANRRVLNYLSKTT